MQYEVVSTQGVVIGEREMGEADRLFSLYTEKFGKISVSGRSIRKIKAKLRGGLQILHYVSLEFIQGKNFYIATDAILRRNFADLDPNPKKFRAALYISNLLDNLIRGEEKEKRIWNLFLETLNDFRFAKNELEILIRNFEWNLLLLLGFKPELYRCVGCENKIKSGKFYFSAKEGGIICEKCVAKIGKDYLKEISRDAIKILRLILSQRKDILIKLRKEPLLERELKEISRLFLYCILEEEIFVV